jgi:hypothetical protein
MHSYDCLYYVDGMYTCMSIIKSIDIRIQLYVLPWLAGQAHASASNGASTCQISPILAGPCLAKDNTALGTVSDAGATARFHTSPTDHSWSPMCREQSPRSLWNNRRAMEPHHKEGAHQVSRPVTPYSCCVRACLHAAHGCCATVQPCTYLYYF